VIKRQLLYLGEINDAQRAQWCSTIDVLDESNDSFNQMSLFPDDRTAPAGVTNSVQVRFNELSLHRPCQWGGCWLAMELWSNLGLDRFWASRLPRSRKGTDWLNVLKTLVGYTACSTRAASGGSTATGSRTAPWPTCSARTTRSRPRTRSTAASTSSANTRPICFPT
jgi:hypothetical protein